MPSDTDELLERIRRTEPSNPYYYVCLIAVLLSFAEHIKLLEKELEDVKYRYRLRTDLED